MESNTVLCGGHRTLYSLSVSSKPRKSFRFPPSRSRPYYQLGGTMRNLNDVHKITLYHDWSLPLLTCESGLLQTFNDPQGPGGINVPVPLTLWLSSRHHHGGHAFICSPRDFHWNLACRLFLAPATVFNVALTFTFFVNIKHCRTNPLTLAMNTFGGDLFSSTKPREILDQVSRVCITQKLLTLAIHDDFPFSFDCNTWNVLLPSIRTCHHHGCCSLWWLSSKFFRRKYLGLRDCRDAYFLVTLSTAPPLPQLSLFQASPTFLLARTKKIWFHVVTTSSCNYHVI